MDVKIRPIEITDAKDIAKYLFVIANEKSIREDIKADLKKMEEGLKIRYVAEVGGKVVGNSQVNINPSPVKHHIAEISGMVVNSDYQGQCISSKLMSQCIEWAKRKGCEKATLGVREGIKAEKVYKHMGFIEYGKLKEGIKEPWGNK